MTDIAMCLLCFASGIIIGIGATITIEYIENRNIKK